MIVEVGHFALVLALCAALAQTIVPSWGARRGDPDLMSVGRSAALTQFALVAVAFAALVNAHLTSDFSVLNVAENSHSAVPTIYKISGVWGNHEGSMLLWVLILAVFGALVALFGRSLPRTLRANALAVQGLISVAFLLFILLTSNPFERLSPAPFEGRDLNPILQDPGLAIHPPLLYLGYVGFSIVYSFAAAALIEGRIDAAWARFVRPFALIAWSLLTLGIAAGSFWAYYTLGWGGFWFWDPVENASLMPWLAGTAFVHSVAVMEKRDALKVWTIFLAIVAFSFSLLGTFLVRSGVLTSVHAFASDPRRGVFILLILALFICGSFALFAWRAPMLRQGGLFAPISREGALVLNNLLLTTSLAVVFFGTVYPLALEQLTGEKITVGAPFFNMTCGALMLTACFVSPVGFSLAWKRGDLLGVAERLTVALAAGALIAVAGAAWLHGQSILASIAAGIAVFAIVGTLTEVLMRTWRPGLKFGVALRRAAGLPLSFWGAALAHIGVGLTLLGLAGVGFGAEAIATLHKGVPQAVGPYEITLDAVVPKVGPNYKQVVAPMTVRSGGKVVAAIAPARRQFEARQMTTTEAGMATLHFGQVYVSIADPTPDGAVPARLYWKPLVTLIWLGGAAMALGGALSLADRRLRFGVAVRARAQAAVAAAE
ncbi:MAG TPA: heme lyase CcmF/NrfE family subunit [Roseiarcus sp.]|jgi:cytochrome c-type biogenesis protein CcmF|nr:heme lyase CcmF/NrfE family subunit [Roseiarcus sp.]